jgi:hypothetical protein
VEVFVFNLSDNKQLLGVLEEPLLSGPTVLNVAAATEAKQNAGLLVRTVLAQRAMHLHSRSFATLLERKECGADYDDDDDDDDEIVEMGKARRRRSSGNDFSCRKRRDDGEERCADVPAELRRAAKRAVCQNVVA